MPNGDDLQKDNVTIYHTVCTLWMTMEIEKEDTVRVIERPEFVGTSQLTKLPMNI